MRKIFGTLFILGIIMLLGGSLLLCFEALAFLLPFSITIMSTGGGFMLIFGMLWLFAPYLED